MKGRAKRWLAFLCCFIMVVGCVAPMMGRRQNAVVAYAWEGQEETENETE